MTLLPLSKNIDVLIENGCCLFRQYLSTIGCKYFSVSHESNYWLINQPVSAVSGYVINATSYGESLNYFARLLFQRYNELAKCRLQVRYCPTDCDYGCARCSVWHHLANTIEMAGSNQQVIL